MPPVTHVPGPNYGPCLRTLSGPRSTKTEQAWPWWFSRRQSGIRLGTSPPVGSDRGCLTGRSRLSAARGHRKSIDGRHLLRSQIHSGTGGIADDAFTAYGLGNHHEAVGDVPGNDHLSCGCIMLPGDRNQDRIAQIAHLEWAVSLQDHAALLQSRGHLRIVERWTPSDLVDLRRHTGCLG